LTVPGWPIDLPGGALEAESLDATAHLRHRSGEPAELVSTFPALEELAGIVVTPTSSALVLGSTQPTVGIDADAAERAGLPRVRRRSGGGGVVVRPGAQVWLDVFIPRTHGLARTDVAKAALVVGEIWAAALRPLLRSTLVVHDGALIETPWSRMNCFSGIGPGEVLLDGRKLVGISQRRERGGTWFFSMAHLTFDAEEQASLVSIDDAARADLFAHLSARVAVLPLAAGVTEAALSESLGAVAT
jgi:lipoate-protein ligase A